MPDSKRQCSKCQFFQNAQLSGNGWCTHPERQLASDVKILVRARELACRNSWGDDLWVDANASRTGPSQPDGAAQPRRGMFFTSQQGDDEVTSVVDTAARQEPGADAPAGPDDVVTFTSVRRDDTPADRPTARPTADDPNAPAIADQAERARLIARGSKDAILKARERHSRRRKPERDATAPDAASDRIIAAQHRDHYTPAPVADRAPQDSYRSTPPVPREEVDAKGNGLAPASGTDSRFDSIAEVRPEVDLSQLRGFLAHSDPSRRNVTARSDAATSSSFDLVLKRAREIKAAGDIERGRRPPPVAAREPARDAAPRIAPRQAVDHPPAGSQPTRGVVWDVEGERLSVAFERARVAIQAPVSPPTQRGAPSPRIDRHMATDVRSGPADIPHPDVDDDPEEVISSPFDIAATDETGSYDAIDQPRHDGDFVAMPLDDDEAWFEPDLDEYQDAPATYRESPRGSWWRSLNFGRKRRYRSAPVENSWHPDEGEEPAGRTTLLAEDAPHAEGGWLDDGLDPATGYDDGAVVVVEEADGPGMMFATSDESWVQDEWEFPEPQPAEWHEARAELLRYPVGDEPADRVPTGDFIDFALDAGRAMDGDDAFPYRDEPAIHAALVRAESPSFAFDEPADMDAFRAALFGAEFSTSPEAPSRTPAFSGVGFDPRERPVPAANLAVATRYAAQGQPARGIPEHPTREPRPDVTSRAPRGSRFSSAHGAFDPEFDIRDAIDDQDAVENLHFDVASRVPKACSTCRSFRPSETGARGWCMNDWSSTHRQMVNADDLACRSSIGDWWLATDTSWIPPADAIQPSTPRTDRLVARTEGRDAVAIQSDRRVRTSKVS